MPSMPTLRNIVNDTPADATDVEFNFNTIETHVANELINRSGAVAMTGALTLPGNPSSALEAAPKQYVDSGLVDKCPVAKWTRTTDMVVGVSSNVQVTPEAEVNDTDGWWPGSGTTFTCPADGLYMLTIWAETSVIGGSTFSVSVNWLTGTVPDTVSAGFPPGTPGNRTSSAVSYMKAGSTFELRASNGTGSSSTLTEMRFTICRLAAI